MSVLVVCATRDRSELVHEMMDSFLATTTHAHLVIRFDDDQPWYGPRVDPPDRIKWKSGPRKSLVDIFNEEIVPRVDEFDMFGMMVDDALFITKGWDDWITEQTKKWEDGVGLVSFHHNYSPLIDMPYVSREWIKRLGWFANPVFKYWGWPTYNIILGQVTKTIQAKPEEFDVQHNEIGPRYWDTFEREAGVFYDECSYRLLGHVAKLKGGKMPDGYYSDNGVDQSIEHLLPDFGYAVDIGANNGEFNSNTYHYEQKGWVVLCVEANPWLADEGRSKRKLWRDVACAAQNGVGEFWAVGGHPWGSSSALVTNGTVPYAASGADPNFGGQVPASHRLQVKIKKLDDLIEEAGFPRVDLLSIDVEGSEDEVLRGFTVERWKPQIIVVENYPDTRTQIGGYEMIERRLYDNVYVRK